MLEKRSSDWHVERRHPALRNDTMALRAWRTAEPRATKNKPDLEIGAAQRGPYAGQFNQA